MTEFRIETEIDIDTPPARVWALQAKGPFSSTQRELHWLGHLFVRSIFDGEH
jgi:hypothetical protein